MNPNLIEALIQKNAFSTDTILTLDYTTTDLFGRTFNKLGDFKINRILKSKDQTIFELVSLDNLNQIIKKSIDNVKAVDGMSMDRYADVYDLLPNGVTKKTGKKRGRKPKQQ